MNFLNAFDWKVLCNFITISNRREDKTPCKKKNRLKKKYDSFPLFSIWSLEFDDQHIFLFHNSTFQHISHQHIFLFLTSELSLKITLITLYLCSFWFGGGNKNLPFNSGFLQGSYQLEKKKSV